jgi:hypothetical protein
MPRQTNVFRNTLALLTGATLLILGIMFSVVVLAVGAIFGLTIWGYLWWKTRKLRRTIHGQATDGLIIAGEAVIVQEYDVRTENILPDDSPGR